MSETARLLNAAAKLASNNPKDKRWLMACISRRADGVLVSSVNHDYPEKSPCHHAEARVLRKSTPGSILYIARVLRSGHSTWALAAPCPTCRNLMRHKRVKRVFYTIGPGEFGEWSPNEK